MTMDHQNSRLRGEQSKYDLACINCLAAGMTHTHKATDRMCPFYLERNNKRNITTLLATICNRHLEGFENPFGLTKIRQASQTSNTSSRSSYDPRSHTASTGNLPTQFLAEAAANTPHDSDESLRLASSNDSLFRHVPNISASQAAAATITEIQDQSTNL